MKPLPTVQSKEPIDVSELPKSSELDRQNHSGNDDNLEGANSVEKVQTIDDDRGRTEYLSEGPGVVKNDIVASGDSPEVEKRMCYQCNGEGEESEHGMDRMNMKQPPEQDALQSSIGQRLAELHKATDFSFTSGLAAQVAARSLTFTVMQEQTFGDEEEEEEIQEDEDCFAKHKGDVNDCEK